MKNPLWKPGDPTDINSSLDKPDNPGENQTDEFQLGDLSNPNGGIQPPLSPPQQVVPPFSSQYQVYGIWADVSKANNDLLYDKEKTTMPDTKIQLVMSGESISDIMKTVNFDLLSKEENVLNIQETDGWVQINLSGVKNWRSLIVFSQTDGMPFDIRITTTNEQIIAKGFDTPADNTIYFANGIVNGRTQFMAENGSYLQWNPTANRWEKYTPASILEAFTADAPVTPDLSVRWIRYADSSYYTSLVMILYTQEPMVISCRDFFSFFPVSDTFMATIAKIEIQTSNGTPTGFFVSSLGSQ